MEERKMTEPTFYGANYHKANLPRRRVEEFWSLKKTQTGGWVVFGIRTGKMLEVFPSKLRAYYAASKMNGMVTDRFNFGDNVLGK
jgi:hypothetical protein